MTAVPWPLLCLSRSLTGQCPRLERFPAKWTRFASRKRVKIENLEPRFDSIETEKALAREARDLDGAPLASGFSDGCGDRQFSPCRRATEHVAGGLQPPHQIAGSLARLRPDR